MSKLITGFKVYQNSKGLLSEVMIEMYVFIKKKIEDLNYSFLFFLRQTVSLRLTCLRLLGARLMHHCFWLICSSISRVCFIVVLSHVSHGGCCVRTQHSAVGFLFLPKNEFWMSPCQHCPGVS